MPRRGRRSGKDGLTTILSFRRRSRKDGWEPCELIVSETKASKADIRKAEKERQAKSTDRLAHIAQEIRKKRTSYSGILNRAATPFEVAYIEFSRQCAVADFEGTKRPNPPTIFSEKLTDEQMPEFLQRICENRFYKNRIHELRSGHQPIGKRTSRRED